MNLAGSRWEPGRDSPAQASIRAEAASRAVEKLLEVWESAKGPDNPPSLSSAMAQIIQALSSEAATHVVDWSLKRLEERTDRSLHPDLAGAVVVVACKLPDESGATAAIRLNEALGWATQSLRAEFFGIDHEDD